METNGTVRIYTISSIVVKVTNVQKKYSHQIIKYGAKSSILNPLYTLMTLTQIMVKVFVKES